jgi:hypothetical protein
MSTTIKPDSGQRFVLNHVRWDFYSRCLAEIGDRRVRLTYVFRKWVQENVQR